ncbi:MAG: 2-oxo acid dehydrogenase subunit E2 [Chloroflexota bacterium]|nr:2-oxo acid dehydrogenase subunit E2 [Chloroflexota bacterium]
MATEVVMPRLSDTMDSGTVARWLKQEGDQITRGEIIAEIETDKANMEMESYANGILAQILVAEGQSAGLGQPIAMIAASQEEAEALRGSGTAASSEATRAAPAVASDDGAETEPAPVAERPAPVQRQSAEPKPTDTKTAATEAPGRIKASPLAKRLAAEQQINLVEVTGTGPGGRITKEDVQAFRKLAGVSLAPPVASEAQQVAAPAPSEVAGAGPRGAQQVEMTRMQRTIARRMAEARFSAPDFVLMAEFDMTQARGMLAGIRGAEGAPKVGPSDLLLKAVATALVQHAEVNSGWENDGIVSYGHVNVGFAVAITGGLVVPVVRDANAKTLGQIAVEAKGLIDRARNNKLTPSEYEGGTFSISNLGMYGIDQFTPIINAPEACILGVGAITPTPVVVDGQVVVRDRMRVTLACDHRVVNGAQGAEFLQTLRRLLDQPLLALL